MVSSRQIHHLRNAVIASAVRAADDIKMNSCSEGMSRIDIIHRSRGWNVINVISSFAFIQTSRSIQWSIDVKRIDHMCVKFVTRDFLNAFYWLVIGVLMVQAAQMHAVTVTKLLKKQRRLQSMRRCTLMQEKKCWALIKLPVQQMIRLNATYAGRNSLHFVYWSATLDTLMTHQNGGTNVINVANSIASRAILRNIC